MKHIKTTLMLTCAALFLYGCSHSGQPSPVIETGLTSQEQAKGSQLKKTPFLKSKKPDESYENISMRFIDSESEALESNVEGKLGRIEKQSEKTVDVEPILPEYDPLEDHMVSFSMIDESLDTVLYLLAESVGMNLILGENINDDTKKVTLHFQKVPAKTVLMELAERFDLHYQVTENIIKINAYTERVFKLNFLDTNVETFFDVGGDVLGAGDTETISGLSGTVRLTGSGSKKGNAYDLLEEMIRNVKTSKGIFTVNRLSGSLYVKDKPSTVKVMSKLVNHYREMLARQILIEARIIEVTLSDGYEYGIDWSILRDEAQTGSKLNKASWNLQSGLVLGGMYKDFNLISAVKALESFGDVKIVSNPTIRARHGSPAIISVGDSISYKKSVDVTTNQNSNTTTDQTVEVEVSTVFDGLILGVIPFIEEGGKINLLINPVKSDVDTNSIENPESIGNGESISLPKVGIKEINTTITMNNGDVVMLGGLISKEENKKDQGVPLLSNVPVLGYLFKNEYLKQERKELVIILSVNII